MAFSKLTAPFCDANTFLNKGLIQFPRISYLKTTNLRHVLTNNIISMSDVCLDCYDLILKSCPLNLKYTYTYRFDHYLDNL